MSREEGLCNEDGEEEDQEISVKLSATPVIKRDTSVATVLVIHGTNPAINKAGPHNQVKDEKQLLMIKA